jgi:DNA-binding FadR family transcriptional regulator
VREALIALEVEGWVEIRTGSGVYVLDRSHRAAPPANGAAGVEWGPLEIIRARRLVEGETAATAAQYGKRKDVDAMRRAIRMMREMAARNEVPHEGDRAFHLAIVNACDNVVLTETVQGFWESRHGPIFARMIDYFETMDSWQAAIGEHEAILDAIAAHDPAAARDAMHHHMDKFHQRFSASWRRTKAS